MNNDRLNHSFSVARKMMDIAKNKNLTEEEINNCFLIGFNHDIEYEFTINGVNHNFISGEILKRSGFKYWKEIYYHGEIDIEYSSLYLDILNQADMQIDKYGNDVGYDKRLEDIRERYGEESKVYSKCLKLVNEIRCKKMVKNIVFDIGNVILNFKLEDVLPKFTNNKEEQEFIINNIINSPEWLGNSLIDTGYISKEEAILIVQDRTNHENDELISNFWNNYNNYSLVDERVIKLIKDLKLKGYKIFLLSNINDHTFQNVNKSDLFSIVDGYVLSYIEHQIKPYKSIYNTLISRYSLIPSETIFIDDNINNINTAQELEFIVKKVNPDDYENVYDSISYLL